MSKFEWIFVTRIKIINRNFPPEGSRPQQNHLHADALIVDGKSAFFVARQTLMSFAAKKFRLSPILFFANCLLWTTQPFRRHFVSTNRVFSGYRVYYTATIHDAVCLQTSADVDRRNFDYFGIFQTSVTQCADDKMATMDRREWTKDEQY